MRNRIDWVMVLVLAALLAVWGLIGYLSMPRSKKPAPVVTQEAVATKTMLPMPERAATAKKSVSKSEEDLLCVPNGVDCGAIYKPNEVIE